MLTHVGALRINRSSTAAPPTRRSSLLVLPDIIVAQTWQQEADLTSSVGGLCAAFTLSEWFFDNLVMKEGKRRRRWPCDLQDVFGCFGGFKELRRYADLSDKEADWV